MPRPRIAPCLWFDGQAEEAARFYVSLFENSAIGKISRFGEGSMGAPGQAMLVEFTLAGVAFQALNGGPMFRFTEAISLAVDCDSQDEVDRLWNALTEGGEESRCGWLKDRYGLSWQIVPRRLTELMSDPDSDRVRRVVAAMMTMSKLDVPALEKASAG